MKKNIIFLSALVLGGFSAKAAQASCASPTRVAISVSNLDYLLGRSANATLCLESSRHQMSISNIAYLASRHSGQVTLVVNDESISISNIDYLLGQGVKVILAGE